MPDSGGQVDGVNWIAAGDGPAILFIHGAGGNAAIWWQQFAHFAADHRVIAFDLPGYGRSEAAPDDAFMARMTHDGAKVLDAAGVGKAAVVCQSLGGWAGLRLARAHGERVTRLVLCATMAGIAHPPALQALMAAQGKMDARGPASLGLTEAFRCGQPAKAALYDQVNAFNGPINPGLGAIILAPDVLVPPAELPDLPCPLGFILGENDPIWPPASIEGLAEFAPAARFETIADTGHSAYFERPDAFNAALRAMLAD